MAIFLPVMLLISACLRVRTDNLRVEEGLDDLSRESVLLVLVLNVSIASREPSDSTHHFNNSSPVFGDLGQVKGLGKVDQVEDILLET